ncbi:hypothetical protein NPIL_591461 [Nephila pilipes]|uniref:Uncharacterized protein n=1 Tax=Nephila pilipes TaxID=299642 RepID=A0A8X6UIJ5_NEPPI|nr:hypothetical protein NPIL_591461 [Nephila pilipes]
MGLNDWSRGMFLSSHPTHSPTFSGGPPLAPFILHHPPHQNPPPPSPPNPPNHHPNLRAGGCLQIGQVLFVFMCLIRQRRWNRCPHNVFSAQCIVSKQMAQLLGVSKIVLGQWSPYRESSTV